MMIVTKASLPLAVVLAGCVTLPDIGDIQDGILKGRVFVEWIREDGFIYRQQSDPLTFQPSFMTTAIVPEDMYTTGGSVPRIFWSIPGLSPWGLGPAYILHDWIFEVHRCNRAAPPEVQNLTFEQSAIVLAEVAKELVDAGLIDNNQLPAIVWAIRTRYARDLWDRPGRPEECRIPSRMSVATKRRLGGQTVVDFTIPSTAE